MNGRKMWRVPAPWIVLTAIFLMTVVPMPTSTADAQSQTMQRILYGEILSAERITIRDRPTGRGAQSGSTIGAVAGYALADRGDRWLGALVGGVLGGAAGNAAEKAKKKKPGWLKIKTSALVWIPSGPRLNFLMLPGSILESVRAMYVC